MKKVKVSAKILSMKILRINEIPNSQESYMQYEKIHREIQLLQSCSHPNIVPLYYSKTLRLFFESPNELIFCLRIDKKFFVRSYTLYGISIYFKKTPFEIGILTPLKWGSLAKLLKLVYEGKANEKNFPNGMNFSNQIKQKIIFGISAGIYYLFSKKIDI